MYKVNVLPLELHRNINLDVKKLIKTMTVYTITTILLVAYGTFIFSYYSTRKEVAETEKELVQLQDTVNKVEKIKKQRQNDELAVQNFKALVDNRKTWSHMLEELNSSLPVDIWLESIDLSFAGPQTVAGINGQTVGKPKIQAKGMQAQAQTRVNRADAGAESGVESDPKGLSQLVLPHPNVLSVEGYSRTVPSVGILVNNLGKMPYLKNIMLNEIREDERHAAVKFKITAMIGESGR